MPNEIRSPCTRPGCIKKNKIKCADDCPELAEYQKYLDLTHDRYSPPGIDTTEEYPTMAPGRGGMLISETYSSNN